ncbi:MAG: hypothetical protein PHQ27_08965 [Victivallales bacterium]|nr:hypothetical protein [Victivallales bacterium]
MNHLGTVLLAMLLPAAAMAAMPLSRELPLSSGIRMEFAPDNSDYEEIRDYLRQLDSIAAQILIRREDSRPTVDCRLVLTGTDDAIEIEQIRETTVIHLPAELRRWRSPLLRRRVMALLLLVKCGLEPRHVTAADRVPCWLATGATVMAESRQELGHSSKNYFELRALDRAGYGLSLDDVIMGDYRPDCGVFYDLFAAGSEYLLTLCLNAISSRRNFMIPLIVASYSSPQQEPWQIFFATAGKELHLKLPKNLFADNKFSPNDQLRIWFRNGLRTRNINLFYPAAAGELHRRFEELRTVTFPVAGKDNTAKDVPCRLENLAASVRKAPDPEGTMILLLDDLASFQNECPRELLPPLTVIIAEAARLRQATASLSPNTDSAKKNSRKTPPKSPLNVTMAKVARLRHHAAVPTLPNYHQMEKDSGKILPQPSPPPPQKEDWNRLTTDYHDHVLAAIGEFEEKIRRQEAVESYLMQMESKFVPPAEQCRFRLKSLKMMDRLNREIWPEINNYLDQLEKEYLRD